MANLHLAFTVFLVVFTMRGHGLTVNDCPDGADKETRMVFGSSCYWFHFHEIREWSQAQQLCEQEGGELARIKTAEIQNALVDHLKNTVQYSRHIEIWFGLSDQGTESTLMWVDGDRVTADSYTNWAPGDGPNHFNHNYNDCAALDPNNGFKWTLLHCQTEIIFIPYHKYFACEAPVTERVTCPPFICTEECGQNGYKVDANGCTMCQCNVPGQ